MNQALRPSFAKVAAMAASNNQSSLVAARQNSSLNSSQPPSADASLLPVLVQPHLLESQDHVVTTHITGGYQSKDKCIQSLNESFEVLQVGGNDDTSGKALPRIMATTNGASRPEDDQTHLSSSSTKPASLDGKSVASGTIFALDEKESLRPDDSASVKAAEEEESYSGPASGAASSRVGSEAGSRAFRDQFYEISDRMGPSIHRGAAVNRFGVPGIQEEDPQGISAPTIPVGPDLSITGDAAFQSMDTPYGFAQQGPDEKLLEAMESPKDRLFLLKLEQDVISFVRDSKEPILDLPPCNSFCRLLAHKLADYYYLTHFVDNAVSAVRLYRTPFCRLPAPLATISNPPTSGNTPPPNAPAVKIMRRTGVGKLEKGSSLEESTTASSAEFSKETSDIGGESGSDNGRDRVHSPTESMTAKEKAAMTREQREAKYKEARERIFKGFEESDNVDTNSVAEESKEVSRSSSTNGRKMPRKQRSAQDDGFEARSQFNAYYPPMRYMNQGFVATGPDTSFYGPYALPLANIGGQAAGLSGQQLPQHGSTYQQTSAYMPQFQAGLQQPFVAGPAISYGQAFADQSTLGYDPMLHSQYNQVPQQTTMASQRSSAMSSPAMSNFAQPVPPQAQTSNQQWTPSYYQSSYQAQALQHPSPAGQRQQYQTTTNMPPLVPYAYGALPSQPFQSGRSTYQNQHPLPGSFNRQSFNPKTQAFVPGSGFVTNQIGGYGPRPYPINANSQGPSHAHMYQASSSMQRQGPQVHGSTSFSMPQPSHGNGSMVSSIPTITAQPPQGRPSGQSSLSKWGTPSHLPPKPPPPQMPNFKTNQPSLPQNVYAAAGSQPYSQHTRSMQHGLPVNNGGTVLPVPGTSIKMT